MKIEKNFIITQFKCNLCKYEWTPRLKNCRKPKPCPNCKRQDLDNYLKITKIGVIP